MKLLLLLVLCVSVSSNTFKPTIKVGSWNLQRLGLSKLSDAKVMDIIFKTISRFDIIALLEVVDSSGKAMPDLLKRLNELNKDDPYELTISERLGRTVYKEQYAFLHKSSVVSVKSTYQYVEPGADVFQFEPFIVTFSGKFDNMRTFAMAPIHTKPDEAEKEISALADVYDKFVADTGVKDVMILGDFNAGCTYVSGKEWDKIKLFTEKRFEWLLSSHTDTTTKATTCPYDRIVINGDKLKNAIAPDSAKPFYFDEFYGIDYKLTIDVSDHYPVEVLIWYDESKDAKSMKVVQKIEIEELQPSAGVNQLIKAAQSSSQDSAKRTLQLNSDNVVATWQTTGTANTIEELGSFMKDYPGIVSERSVQVMEYKVKQQSRRRKHEVTVTCETNDQRCSSTVAWEGHFY